MNTALTRALAVLGTATMLTAPALSTPLVYEGYDYALADGTSMSGVTASGTGITGNYSLLNAGTGGSLYDTTGLSFGTNFLPTSGGSVLLTAASGYSVMSIGLDAGSITGSLYSSYLAEFNSFSGALGTITHRVSQGGAATRRFTSDADSRTEQRPAVGYGETAVPASSGSLVTGETYLVLARFTNVGLAGGGTADQFVFTLTDYDAWIANGAMESTLGTYATFTASDTIGTQKDFNNSFDLEFGVTPNGGTGTEAAYIDELRYGTDLFDVVGVPEPASGAMALGGLGLLLVLRRGRRA